MLNDTKRRALRAAQQVSFVAVAACSVQLGDPQAAGKQDGATDQDAASAYDAAAQVDSSPDAIVIDAVADQSAVVDATKASCAEFETAINKGASSPLDLADSQACCKAFFTRDFDWGNETNLISYCCSNAKIPQNEIPVACTPWGPPMPPAMV